MFNPKTACTMIIVIALALFTLLGLLMAPAHGWYNLLSGERNALVFQGRHQAYGAFRLRRRYGHHLALGLLMTLGLVAAVALVAKLLASEVGPPPPVPKASGIDGELSRVFTFPPEPPAGPKAQALAPPVTSQAPPDRDAFRPVEAGDGQEIPQPPALDSTAFGQGEDLHGAGTDVPGAAGGVDGGPDEGGDALAGRGSRVYDGIDVQELPEFPGGEAGLAQWVNRNLDYFPEGEGLEMIFVRFTVMADGRVVNVEAVKGRSRSYREAAERALRRMPRWKPARMNGQEVPCRLTLPIRFETR